MFGWLKRRDERLIYRYHDGKRWQRIDPLVAWQQLWTDPECKPEEDLPGWQRNELECVQRVYGMTCRIFSLTPYDKGGLTVLEALKVFNDFLGYIDSVKKKHGALPIPFRLWASQFSQTQKGATTKSAADSPGTPSESTPGEPIGSGEPLSPPLAAA